MFGRIPILQQSLLVAAIWKIFKSHNFWVNSLLFLGELFSFSNSWSLHLQFPVHIPLFVPYPVISSCWCARSHGRRCLPPSFAMMLRTLRWIKPSRCGDFTNQIYIYEGIHWKVLIDFFITLPIHFLYQDVLISALSLFFCWLSPLTSTIGDELRL